MDQRQGEGNDAEDNLINRHQTHLGRPVGNEIIQPPQQNTKSAIYSRSGKKSSAGIGIAHGQQVVCIIENNVAGIALQIRPLRGAGLFYAAVAIKQLAIQINFRSTDVRHDKSQRDMLQGAVDLKMQPEPADARPAAGRRFARGELSIGLRPGAVIVSRIRPGQIVAGMIAPVLKELDPPSLVRQPGSRERGDASPAVAPAGNDDIDHGVTIDRKGKVRILQPGGIDRLGAPTAASEFIFQIRAGRE